MEHHLRQGDITTPVLRRNLNELARKGLDAEWNLDPVDAKAGPRIAVLKLLQHAGVRDALDAADGDEDLLA
ncbi:MAG: hypothetical protein Q8N53_10485 [Longimicrobiales bacterium]|nr:hypothetical protein [Longimicrobiales bacterium]